MMLTIILMKHNPKKTAKFSIVFDDMIADIMTNKKFQSIIKELFNRCRELKISLDIIAQSYFSVPKEARLNSAHHIIIKIHNKKKRNTNTATNHSADIVYKDLMKLTIFFFGY